MKLPPAILPDGDGDGVTDQFDREPKTPKGCPVNTHGVSLDTDGDGVPDCKDKELLTKKECFPVDSSGVGVCPRPPCCNGLAGSVFQDPCIINELPSVIADFNSAVLANSTKLILKDISNVMFANPAWNVKVLGYFSEGVDGSSQRSANEARKIVYYLISPEGISKQRFSQGTR
jgi:outer membrane protein OmpA-like peptidoglycan-associated protein